MLEPESEKELVDIVTSARGPFRIKGGGTRGIIEKLPGETIETRGLNGIRLYDPGALTLVAGSGTPLSMIDEALAAHGQYLPFEPTDYRGLMDTTGDPTIGGVFASNNSGSRRIQTGAARDFLLGVRFVDGNGHIIKNGGRVMKNVTGYDLVKLMCGSFGTLGIITEVAMKVLPAPKTQATLIFDGLNDEQAVQVMSKALGSPFDVNGAVHFSSNTKSGSSTLIRLEGFVESVRYRAGQLEKRLENFGPSKIEGDFEKSTQMWKDVQNLKEFNQVEGDVWRISTHPSTGPNIAAKLNPDRTIFDWGGGLIWALVPQGTDVRKQLGGYSGHATLIRTSENRKTRQEIFEPQPKPLARISQGLRRKFDPREVFNVGLMGNTQ